MHHSPKMFTWTEKSITRRVRQFYSAVSQLGWPSDPIWINAADILLVCFSVPLIVRPVHSTRTYGPYVRACFLRPFVPVRTGRFNGPYIRTGSVYVYVRPVRKKALHAMLFAPYVYVYTTRFNGPYVRVVCTGRPFMSPAMLYPFNWF